VAMDPPHMTRFE